MNDYYQSTSTSLPHYFMKYDLELSKKAMEAFTALIGLILMCLELGNAL